MNVLKFFFLFKPHAFDVNHSYLILSYKKSILFLCIKRTRLHLNRQIMIFTHWMQLGDSAPTDCVRIKHKPKKSRRGRGSKKMRMITRTNTRGGGLKKMNPCPRVINQRTKVGGEETRIIQFHGWNINNGVRGPWIISGRRGISRTSISTPLANNLTSVPLRLNISETAAVVGLSVRVYCIYVYTQTNKLFLARRPKNSKTLIVIYFYWYVARMWLNYIGP